MNQYPWKNIPEKNGQPIATQVMRSGGLWLAVVVILTALGWLVIHWPHNSLWYDEALTTYVATDSWATLWNWCTHVDIQVPFHYLVLRGWGALLGDSEFALRALSVISIVLASAGLIAIGKRFRRPGVGYVAALLFAMLPGMRWVGYEVRAYALALALYCWATVFLLHIIDHPRRRWVILAYAALMVSTLYTHYTALAGFAAHLAILGLLWLSRPSWPFLRTIIVTGTLVLIGFSPWLPTLLTRSASDRSYYTGQAIPPLRSIEVMLGFKLQSREDIGLETDLPLIELYGGVLLIGIVLNLRHGRALITALAITIVPIALTATLVYFKPKLAGRYAWPAWIGLDVLAALAILAVSRGRRELTMALAIVVIATPNLIGVIGHPPESDFRAAYAYLCSHGTAQDVILLRDGTLFVTADYYGRRPPCDTPRRTIQMPPALITDVSQFLTLPETQSAMRQIQELRPPNVWVIAWQGDVMDPQGLAYGLLEPNSQHTLAGQMFGDVRLDRFEQIALTAPAIDHPDAAGVIVSTQPIPDGPTLQAYQVFAPAVAKAGDVLVLQTWWRAGKTLQPDLRVSARITTLDNGWIYAQVDQPPAGWKYVDDRWLPGIPALGRYELRIGSDVPKGKVALRYVIYDAGNRIPPIILKVAEITIG